MWLFFLLLLLFRWYWHCVYCSCCCFSCYVLLQLQLLWRRLSIVIINSLVTNSLLKIFTIFSYLVTSGVNSTLFCDGYDRYSRVACIPNVLLFFLIKRPFYLYFICRSLIANRINSFLNCYSVFNCKIKQISLKSGKKSYKSRSYHNW